jgi:rubrerythrin
LSGHGTASTAEEANDLQFAGVVEDTSQTTSGTQQNVLEGADVENEKTERSRAMRERSESRWVTSHYHPYIGIVVKCEACGHCVKDDVARSAKFCPGCGAAMTNSGSNVFPGYFQALDAFTKD